MRSLWDRYLDLNPIYYLFDLYTCSILDQNQKENDVLLRKPLLISIIDKEHNKQVSWHYCWGLDNSPLLITSQICIGVLIHHIERSEQGFGAVTLGLDNTSWGNSGRNLVIHNIRVNRRLYDINFLVMD